MKVNIGKFPKSNTSRRVDIKIDSFDTWNLDNTLALIVLPALLQLKQEKHGVPSEFADVGGDSHGYQSSFDFYTESHDDAFKLGIERWDVVLDKMIWSFYQLVTDDWSIKYYHGKADYGFQTSNETYVHPVTGKSEPLMEMVDNNPAEHWVDYEGMYEHERRIQEGLDLFAKYYRSLWD